MGGGASKKNWQRGYHLTMNEVSEQGDQFNKILPVWTCAVTYNMKQLAHATGDHRIHLWCLVNKILLISLMGHTDTIWTLAYDRTDTLLASGSADGTVRLWEVRTGLMFMLLPRSHANWVWCLAWSPDSSRLVTGGSDTRILVWGGVQNFQDAAKEEDEVRLDKLQGRDHDPGVAEQNQEKLMHAAQMKMPQVHWQAHEKSVNGICFFPEDEKKIASAGGEGSIAIWEVQTGNLYVRLQGHLGAVTSVSVSIEMESGTGKAVIATGGEDHTVRLWDLGDVGPKIQELSRKQAMGHNLPHFTLKGHEDAVSVVRFTGDARLLASSSKDCEVRIWNPNMGNPTLNMRFLAHESWVRDLAWMADNRFLFSAATDGLVFAWEVPKTYHNHFLEDAASSKKKKKKKNKAEE